MSGVIYSFHSHLMCIVWFLVVVCYFMHLLLQTQKLFVWKPRVWKWIPYRRSVLVWKNTGVLHTEDKTSYCLGQYYKLPCFALHSRTPINSGLHAILSLISRQTFNGKRKISCKLSCRPLSFCWLQY